MQASDPLKEMLPKLNLGLLIPYLIIKGSLIELIEELFSDITELSITNAQKKRTQQFKLVDESICMMFTSLTNCC